MEDQWYIDNGMLTPDQTRKKWDEIYAGLAQRGFAPLDGPECSKGKCHTPDEKHYILVTDGLVVYSTVPNWDQTQYVPGSIWKDWGAEEFTFEEFDEVMVAGETQSPRQTRLEQIWGHLWYMRLDKSKETEKRKQILIEEMDILDPSGMGILDSLRGW